MATAGNFPKVTGDIIYLADHNAIQSVIAGVVSTYYSNSIGSSQLSGTPVVSAAQMDLLRLDLDKAYKHITGSITTLTDLALGNLISKDDFNAYKTAADYCETNKATVHPTQESSVVNNTSLTDAWNGSHTWTYTYTWASAALAQQWFNCGGRFVVDVSGDGSTGSSKDIDWQDNILNAIPTQTYGKTQWDAGTAVSVSESGNTSQYVENFCQITFTKVSTTELSISVILNDADTGDKVIADTGGGPFGTAIDEDVNTNAYASITSYTSIDAITATASTPSNTANW